MREKAETHFFVLLVIFLCVVSFAARSHAGLRGDTLFLSESPPSSHRDSGQGRSQRGVRPGADRHSEHRAVPMKKLYLNTHSLSDDAKAYVVRPDGTAGEVTLAHDERGWVVTVDTRPMDKTSDGIFIIYVVDREVADGVLMVKVAKMNVVNHSCGWGHTYKHDAERLSPRFLADIPLEVVGSNLWDRNFHVGTMSGDTIPFSVLSKGKPVGEAKVMVRTQTGWMKIFRTAADGSVPVQLIRDYYPEKWDDFKSRKRHAFLVTAEYETEESGVWQGEKYAKVKYTATLPWTYQPQRKEYTSHAYGLSIGTLFAVGTLIAVYIHRERRTRPYKEVTFNE